MKNWPSRRIAAFGFLASMISFSFFDVKVRSMTLVTDPDKRIVWEYITDLGNSGWMLVVALLAWLVGITLVRFHSAGDDWQWLANRGLFVLNVIVATGVFTLIAKSLVGRARPTLFDTEGPMGFDPLSFSSAYASWPSGHTTTAFAMATAITLLYPRFAIIAFPLAILAGFSRMSVGAHYLGDVIMGATVGTLGAILVYRWLAPRLKLEG